MYACLKSEPTLGTTSESVPSGVSAPNLSVLSADSVKATWSEPSEPNGILHHYELWRRRKMLCSDM